MYKPKLLWGAALLATLSGPSCAEDDTGAPSIILGPRGEPTTGQASGFALAGHLSMEVHPLEGTAEVHQPVEDHRTAALFYTNFSGAPLGTGAGTVRIFTDPTKITYVDRSGVCHSNGTIGGAGCTSLRPPCDAIGMFCTSLRVTSNFAFALPDLMVQIANANAETRNAILNCQDAADGSFGLCRSNPDNSRKVDSPSSTLTSPVVGCSYCYGNVNLLGTANAGLRDAVMPGAASGAINTDTFALAILNDNTFRVDIPVFYAGPFAEFNVTLDNLGTTPSCASRGATVVKVGGGGFGPPGDCAGAPAICSAAGPPGAGYAIDYQKTPTNIVPPAPGSVVWSDNLISGRLATSATPGNSYHARVFTPLAPGGVLSGPFAVCRRNPGPATHFALAVFGSPQAGSPFSFSVVAYDAAGRRVTDYGGTVALTITPNGTVTPSSYTFVAADSGGHLFTSGAQAAASGLHTITATAPGGVSGSITFNVN